MPAVLLLVPLLLVAGCGQGKVFTAEEFVAEANRNGAGLELGGPLISPGPDRDVYALEVEEADRPGAGREEPDHAEEPESEASDDGHEHGSGGSLTVTEDSDAGRTEFERCDSAVSLLCYRAANMVVAFENTLPVELQNRVEEAIVAMGSG